MIKAKEARAMMPSEQERIRKIKEMLDTIEKEIKKYSSSGYSDIRVLVSDYISFDIMVTLEAFGYGVKKVNEFTDDMTGIKYDQIKISW